eukprot:jgi/Ulvmu1/8441/UM043_0019.1
MQLLTILVALGAVLHDGLAPAHAQRARRTRPTHPTRPSRPPRSQGFMPTAPPPTDPAPSAPPPSPTQEMPEPPEEPRGFMPTPPPEMAEPPTPEPPSSDSADFVIVGGGTAGCVLAARLCENLPDASVVLLERGTPRTADQELLIRAPRLFGQAWNNPALSEDWQTEPNPGLDGQTLRQLTGNTLGGSSAINGAQWTKPPLATFDSDTWSFTGLSSTKAGELYRRAEAKLSVGPIPVSQQQTYAQEYLNAAAAIGIPTIADPLARTGPVTDGMWINALAVDAAGRRQDSCTAYLSPVIGPGNACAANLRLEQSATVSRVVIEGGRAMGVQYLKTDAPAGEQEREIAAVKEVISAAGPFGSPRLLQLSGLGPPALLDSLGVPVVVDLPVGENTVARGAPLIIDTYNVPLAPEGDAELVNSAAARATFEAGDGGVLAVATGGVNGALADQKCYMSYTNVPLPGDPGDRIVSLAAVNPTARGSVRAASTDPRESVRLETNILGNEEDVQTGIACLSRLQEVHTELTPVLGLQSLVPGPQFNGEVSRETVLPFTSPFNHFVAGCALGDVVDGDFKVNGVQALRVVDASVQPEMPMYAGPAATTYMLAELASEIVTATHQQR